jgi:thymidylate kinase
MLIFEGVDFSGKSTIIKTLKTYDYFSDWQIFNYFKIKEKFPESWLENIDLCAEIEYNCLIQLKQSKMILDRFYISSIIYNKVFDRKYDVSYINQKLFQKDLVIYVSIDNDVLIKRAKIRSEDKKIIDKLIELNQEYKNFFDNSEDHCLILDGTVNAYDNTQIIKSVVETRSFLDNCY